MRWAVALCWGLWSAPLYAQAPSPVTLDVVVDGAAAARPLTPSDFVVTDTERPIAVRAVRLVEPTAQVDPLPAIASADDEETAAAQADRLVGIYIDEYHLEDDAAWASLRVSLASWLRTALGPRDMVIIVRPLDSLVSLRLTTDRESAARSVEEAMPRQGDYVPRSDFERNFFAGAPSRVDAARNQISLSAIRALASHLGQFPAGRKTLLVASNGLTGPSVSRRASTLPESILLTANMTHVAIYAFIPTPTVDVAGTAAVTSPDVSARDVLRELADQTTGFVAERPPDMESGLRRALQDASRYYELVLESDAKPDGRLQPAYVTLRTPSTRVRARAGFGRSMRVSYPAPQSKPAGFGLARHTSTLIRTWFGQVSTDAGLTRVAFVWEPAPRVPGARGVMVVPAKVAMRVARQDGTPVFEGTSGPSGRGALLVGGARPELVFQAAPGTLLVQMDVLDAAGRVLDQDVRDLTVATLERPIGFGTAAIFRGRSQRDVEAILSDPSVAPVAAREFSRAERLVVRVPLVGSGAVPELTARLHSRFGSPVRDLSATVLAGSSRIVQVELPLASLASGAYAVVFTARDSQGAVVESVDFIVTP